MSIVLLGDSGVGKSSIIYRIINKKFYQDIARSKAPTFSTKDLFLKGINVRLNLDIWDIPGEERYFSLLKIL